MFQPVMTASEIPPGEALSVDIGRRRILLCNTGGDIYAIADVCTHDGQALDAGELEGCIIECPRHGARFDVRTGAVRALPATRPLPTYPVRIIDGVVEVELADDGAGGEDEDDDLLDF
jgi:3-phenylpropionate/trans-cinnamate dioxygenase ferredoxin subunit